MAGVADRQKNAPAGFYDCGITASKRKDQIPVFRPDPIAERLNDPSWEASLFKEAC
jgi:hypothetical protein